MKSSTLCLLLAAALSLPVHAADSPATAPADSDAAQLEQQWQKIWPELFSGEDGQKHVGARVRFKTGPFTHVIAGPPLIIKSRAGETIQVTNVPKSARTDINTLRKPPTIVTVEGAITAIDASKKVVTIKASKVDVSW